MNNRASIFLTSFFSCFLFALRLYGATAQLSYTVESDGSVPLTIKGTFEECIYCDDHGKNCWSNHAAGSVYILSLCGESGHGTASCTAILDRGSLNRTHTFRGVASDCKGSASDSVTIMLDNTPAVSISGPSGTVSEPFDITGHVAFKPTLQQTKGTINVYINGGHVAGKYCTTEECDFSYKELTGNLCDRNHGGPYTIKLVATSGGASSSAEGTFSVDKTPTVSISEPSGMVLSPFDIAGHATFRPTLNQTKGTIYVFVNKSHIATKSCITEQCSYNYEELSGYLVSRPAGTYTILLRATGSRGGTAEDSTTILVEDLLPDQGCPDGSLDPCSPCEK